MPPQNDPADKVPGKANLYNQPFYPLHHTWKRRRDATSVLKGHFDPKPSVVSHYGVPPLEEREPNMSSRAHNTHLAGPSASSSSSNPGTSAVAGREAAVPSSSAHSSSTTKRAPKSASRKSNPSHSSHPNASKAKAPKLPGALESSADGIASASKASQPQSNSRFPPSAASALAAAFAEKSNCDSASNKRAAPVDASDNLPPSKKPRGVPTSDKSTTHQTSANGLYQSSSAPIPRYTTSPPSLTNSLTTVESRPSSPTIHSVSLRNGAHGTISPSPQPSNASTSGTAGGAGAGVPGRSFSSANRRPAVKKGWKGWLLVEDDEVLPESPTLIKIDEPIILPKTRQTRSGRTFAGKRGDLMVGVTSSPAPEGWQDDLSVDPDDDRDERDELDSPSSDF